MRKTGLSKPPPEGDLSDYFLCVFLIEEHINTVFKNTTNTNRGKDQTQALTCDDNQKLGIPWFTETKMIKRDTYSLCISFSLCWTGIL